MILQQLPGTVAAPAPAAGPPYVRGDLIELMMIQNSQMHQVVMNSLAVSALTSFGFGPSPATAQVTAVPLQTGEEEEAVVFHHHYVPYPGPAPVLVWPVPARDRGPAAVRYLGTGSLAEDREQCGAPPSTSQRHGDCGSQCPTSIGVLRRGGGEAVSSMLPKMVSPARPTPQLQKILQVLSMVAPWYP
ncbi:proline-rich protein 29 isoform X3 [Opisthocomus hoazin]|uniref:proline-rich protein 29 isoform X3 n=1 Tax=Opisthocomus hoazin TaxID=30419 RepID=UPI003F53B713